MNNRFIVSSVLILVIISCSINRKMASIDQPDKKYKEISERMYGENADCIYNSDETMVLCLNETHGGAQNPVVKVDYFVYKFDEAKIIHKGFVDNGSVSWYDQNRLSIFQSPGIIREDQSMDDYTKIYNLLTGKTYSKRDIKEY